MKAGRILGLLVLFIFFCGCMQTVEKTTTTAPGESGNGRIIIATSADMPPYTYVDDKGVVQGFDIEVARALCRKMNVECVFVVRKWETIIPGLLNGDYDAIASEMAITDWRKEQVAFTKSYNDEASSSVFIARKDANLVISNEGLRGRKISATKETIYSHYLEGVYGGIATIKLYDGDALADEKNDLISGAIDAVFDDKEYLGDWVKENPNLVLVGEEVSDPKWLGDGVGIAVRKEDTRLLERFNTALDEIKADGTYNSINETYNSQ